MQQFGKFSIPSWNRLIKKCACVVCFCNLYGFGCTWVPKITNPKGVQWGETWRKKSAVAEFQKLLKSNAGNICFIFRSSKIVFKLKYFIARKTTKIALITYIWLYMMKFYILVLKKVMCLTMVPGGDKAVWGKANKLK